jgi:hypothetical protein
VAAPIEPQVAVQAVLSLALNCRVDASLNVAAVGLTIKAGAVAMASTTLAV